MVMEGWVGGYFKVRKFLKGIHLRAPFGKCSLKEYSPNVLQFSKGCNHITTWGLGESPFLNRRPMLTSITGELKGVKSWYAKLIPVPYIEATM